MSEFDELVSRDGVLIAGRFGPDGHIAEHQSKGLFIEIRRWRWRSGSASRPR